MIKEIQPLDLFDIAGQSFPPDVIRKKLTLDSFASWRGLAGSIWGAMRRGRSGEDIWEEVSSEFQGALSHKKNTKEAQLLIPYVARLVMDLHNSLNTAGNVLCVDDLVRLRPDSPVNSYLEKGLPGKSEE